MDKRKYRELEKILKGAASHRRLQILDLLTKGGELSVTDISEALSIDFRTASEHLRKLAHAGLIIKRHDGPAVMHALTKRGEIILMFCRTLE